MMRLLVLVGAAVVIASLINEGLGRLHSKLGERLSATRPTGRVGGAARRGGELVACSACGVHVLRSRAFGDAAGILYCTETCRRSAVTGR